MTNFPEIRHIADVQPQVASLKEIRFLKQPNGCTVGCYMFMDSGTFNTPEARECRGIAFDEAGLIVSRPLHKFFNLGEKESVSLSALQARTDLVAVFEKLDGSMLATAWIDNQLHWRSKKSFTADVVRLTQALTSTTHGHVQAFAAELAQKGLTAIFELMHPQARIVVAAEQPSLRLLHVRDNITGEYVSLDPHHFLHDRARHYGIEWAPRFEGWTLDQAVEALASMENQEGFVLQYANGDMVKLKCPWYLRLHRSVTFMRERDVALLCLREELDDLKAHLNELGMPHDAVNAVEHRVAQHLVELWEDIEQTVEAHRHLDRKAFALALSKKPLFGLYMTHYLGKEVELVQWYEKNRLKTDFDLKVLLEGAVRDEIW